jgi:choline monooxygenase
MGPPPFPTVDLGDYDFEPVLARARTPPSRWYVDPAILRVELERVFGRTWQLVGRNDRVASPGDYFTTRVGTEGIVVARGGDRVLRAFSNVCRHRAGPVARGSGHALSLKCSYHGWTYGLDGGLLATPEFDEVEGFDRASCRLPAVRLAEWEGFVFTNLDADAPPLSEFLGSLPVEVRHLPLARMRLVKAVDYDMACNWKVYVDNYLEGYHIPVVHPSLFRLLDYGAYRVEASGLHARQHAPLRAQASEAFYFWVFPNLMLNVYPDSFQLNLVTPLDSERTRARFEWYLPDPARPGAMEELERAMAFSEEVQREDTAICEAVQEGLRSRTYDRGRYSVRRENGVHHFHGLLHRFVVAGPTPRG